MTPKYEKMEAVVRGDASLRFRYFSRDGTRQCVIGGLVAAMPRHARWRRVLSDADDGLSIRATELRDVRRRLERYYGVADGVLIDLQYINDNIPLLAARRRFLLRYLAYVQTRTAAVGQGAGRSMSKVVVGLIDHYLQERHPDILRKTKR